MNIIPEKENLRKQKSDASYSHIPVVHGARIKTDENGHAPIVCIKEKSDEKKTLLVLEQNTKLGEALHEIPYGVVKKSITGIGATTLELQSKRKSIIVVPTKSLAYNKHTKHSHSFYVGSSIPNHIDKPSTAEIKAYAARKDIIQKYIVVADSLKRVINAIGDNVYTDYFIMVDEVDIIQSDVTYRPALEDVIDYYFLFEPQNRCVVSATMRGFSHPKLHNEPIIIIRYPERPKREIILKQTDNIHLVVKEEIEKRLKESEEKILIAYNSVGNAKKIIKQLPEEVQTECAILCSEVSKIRAGDFYTLLIKGKLEKRITFMTCAYFVGIDIEDQCHIISVSNTLKPYTLLSANKYTQIHGRCRNGALSECIIFDINPRNNEQIGKREYEEGLLNKADKVAQLYAFADQLSEGSPEIKSLFDILKSAIQEKATERIAGEKAISLTRKNIDGKYCISYFSIDALIERKGLYIAFYAQEGLLVTQLSDTDKHNITFEITHRDITPEQTEIENLVDQESLQNIIVILENEQNKILSLLGDTDENDAVYAEWILIKLKSMKRNVRNRDAKEFYDRILRFYPYYSIAYITQLLINIYKEDKNNTYYKGWQNALMFNALTEEHQFKQMIKARFPVGEKLTSEDIVIRMTEIYNVNNLYRNDNPNTLVKQLRQFVDTSRWTNRKGYTVEGYNPKELPEPMNKIQLADAKNLREIFAF